MLEKSSEYIYIRYCLFEVVAVVYVNMENLLYTKDAVIMELLQTVAI